MIKRVREPLSEVSLYIGSAEGYGGKEFSQGQLTEAISEFQADHETKHGYLCPVRLETCRFISKDYREDGFEMTVINYPRWPRTDVQLCDFMTRLGEFLMFRFKQNRLSVVARTREPFIELLEHPQAAASHK